MIKHPHPPALILGFAGCNASECVEAWVFSPLSLKVKEPLPGVLEEGMLPRTEGMLESSLYVDEVTRSRSFYEEIFGFEVIADFGGRGCAMNAGNRHVLLLFKKGASREIQSPHDGDGELHIAFAIAARELSNWESWLHQNGIAIEERRTWPAGGQSVYFRDPDRHLLELVTPGTWTIY